MIFCDRNEISDYWYTLYILLHLRRRCMNQYTYMQAEQSRWQMHVILIAGRPRQKGSANSMPRQDYDILKQH